MATRTKKPVPPDVLNGQPPPLESGDCLDREEFERRYEAMPHLKKAELIEGVVYVPSPVSLRRHGRPQVDLITWLGVYLAATPGLEAGDNTTARLDLANVEQPDTLLLIDPSRGGQALITADGFIEGAPELVAEVAATTVSIDLNAKLAVYQRAGVREYIVSRVLDQEVDWFVLHRRRYRRLKPNAQGLLSSTVVPGFWLDPAALVRGDLAKVLAALQQSLSRPEHAAFVARLNQPSDS
jgi:Uma2 family endonuclease